MLKDSPWLCGGRCRSASSNPAGFDSSGVICECGAPAGQAPAGSVITWHGERADLTQGTTQLRPDAEGTHRPLSPNLKIRLETTVPKVAFK